jgi:hypothetical protein
MTCDGISRRNVLAVLGLGALSLASPVVLTARSEAQAVVAPLPPTGTERRVDRRVARTERRQDRRIRRAERRQMRREGRMERRAARREGRAMRREIRQGM